MQDTIVIVAVLERGAYERSETPSSFRHVFVTQFWFHPLHIFVASYEGHHWPLYDHALGNPAIVVLCVQKVCKAV